MRSRSHAGGRTRARLVLVALALLSGALVGSPAHAGGTSVCTYSGNEVVVDLQQDQSSGILSRDAVGLILYQDENTATPQPCGLATLATTDLIRVKDTSNDGSTSIILDIREGHFADGGNEIPIKINLRRGAIDAFGVISGTGDDFFTFGTAKGNLQKDTNAEIEFANLPDFGFATPQGGEDHACASGGRGTGNTSVIGWVFLGGANDDTLCGGLVSDRLVGGGGNDLLRGQGGGDSLKGRTGNDRLRGNSNTDLLVGNKGADDLNGGPATDTCDGGPGPDQKARCERR